MPLAIDLFCGLGGWTDGLLAEDYDVVGFDNERHVYGDAQYPAQLVLQDVLTLHGAQFKTADLIVASPPCQAYSYRAMPWKRAKALPPPSNELFDACFRIQREACEAAGRYIPLVVENVCGAQKWVGRARWHYGSFYLWGDVPALMPFARHRNNGKGGPSHEALSKFVGSAQGGFRGGSWFDKTKFSGPEGASNRALAALTGDAIKVAGFRFDGSGGSFQSASVKVSGLNWSNYGKPGYKAEAFNTTAEQRLRDGRKVTKDGQGGYGGGFGWDDSPLRRGTSKWAARKAASAHIAKIPEPLARWIARAWKPDERRTG